jgi:succinate dehydrogenase flavin-adding protein (antitoxin of CptAB toxin-antitoxin module)
MLNPQDVLDLEAVLKNNDMDLFKWASGKAPVPVEWDTPVMRQIIKYCGESQS